MLQSPPLASPALFGDTMKMALAQLYCVCRQPYDANRFMIECDICKDWFHGSCVKVEEHHAMDIDVYHCPNCDGLHGPSVMKKRNNWHRHDYTEPDDGTKPVQAGTSVFIRELQARTFASGDEILVQMQGSQVTQKYLEREGFHHPIVVFDKEGLGLRVPPPSFSVEDVQRFVGGDKIIDVIDVARQADSKMKLSEFVKYYYRPVRPKVLNVISLEFSDTKMADLVVVPELAQKMSWVEKYWPDDSYFPKPFVQKYCLMGVKDSYTDFHIDFGGTSVWYHVLWGEKIFYLIEPTEANLALYEAWSSSPKQSEVFFGEKVEKCHKCVVQQGTTVLIPTGWIHAVLTSQDCMAFGGNFLHNLNIGMQLRCYEMERRLKTPDLFKFPYFEAICWYVAKNLLEKLRELREDNSQPKAYLVDGVKALITALKNWLRREVNEPTSEVPDHIRPYYLIKELAKEIRHLGEDQSTTGVKTMKSQGHAENPLMLSASERVSQERRAARKLQDHHHQHHHTPKVHSNLDILERHTQEVLKRLEAGPLDEDLPFSSKVNGKFNKVCTASAAAVERSHKNNLRLMLCNGRIIRDGRHRVMRRSPLKLESHWTSLSQQKESKTERAAMGLMENCTAGDEKSTNHDSRDIQPDPRQRATERLAVSDVESDSTSRKEENDSSEEDSRRSEDERPEDERPHENDKRSGKGMQRHAGRQHSQNRRALKRERPTSPSTEEAIQGMLSMAGLLCPPAPEDGGHTQEPWWSTRSLVSPESTRGHQRPGHQQGRFMDSQGNSSSEAWDSHELPSSPHSPMRPDASPGQDYPYRESSLSPPLHPSKRHASNPAPITNQATKGKRPKKGTVTAKQRLGKILKLSHHSQLFV